MPESTGTPADLQHPTAEQAGEALRALISEQRPQEPEPEEPEPAAEEAPAETVPEEPAPEAEAQAAPAVDDDVESLKKRLTEREAEIEKVRKSSAARVDAIQRRSAQNEQILRDRFLRKATVTDKALRTLKATRSEGGVPQEEVDSIIREIEGTMNPASPSYSPPTPIQEDQAIIMNAFLNEKGLTLEDADEFGKWMRSDAQTALSPIEQAVAGRDLDGFLRIAHTRYLESEKSKEQRRNDTVEAVRSVQRTQKAASAAASARPAAPAKQPAAPRPLDMKDLKPGDISALLRRSVEEAKRGD